MTLWVPPSPPRPQARRLSDPDAPESDPAAEPAEACEDVSLELLQSVGLLESESHQAATDDPDDLADQLLAALHEQAIQPVSTEPFFAQLPAARGLLRESGTETARIGEPGRLMFDTITRLVLSHAGAELEYPCRGMRHFAAVFNEVLRLLGDRRRYHSYYYEDEIEYVLLTPEQARVIVQHALLPLFDEEEDLPELPLQPVAMLAAGVPQRVGARSAEGCREIAAVLPLSHSATLTSRMEADYKGGLMLRWPIAEGVVMALVRGHGEGAAAVHAARLAWDELEQGVRRRPFPPDRTARDAQLGAVLRAADRRLQSEHASASALLALVTPGQLDVAYVGDLRLWHMSSSARDEQGLHLVRNLTAAWAQAQPPAAEGPRAALGTGHPPVSARCALDEGDRILIATARLLDHVPDDELARRLRQTGPTAVFLLTALEQAVPSGDHEHALLVGDLYLQHT